MQTYSSLFSHSVCSAKVSFNLYTGIGRKKGFVLLLEPPERVMSNMNTWYQKFLISHYLNSEYLPLLLQKQIYLTVSLLRVIIYLLPVPKLKKTASLYFKIQKFRQIINCLKLSQELHFKWFYFICKLYLIKNGLFTLIALTERFFTLNFIYKVNVLT